MSEEHILLNEIAAGNIDAFETLFFNYHPRLVNFLAGLTHDKEISRDMAQDLFLSIWKERSQLNNIRSFPAYLFQMARFTVCDYLWPIPYNERQLNTNFTQNPGYGN